VTASRRGAVLARGLRPREGSKVEVVIGTSLERHNMEVQTLQDSLLVLCVALIATACNAGTGEPLGDGDTGDTDGETAETIGDGDTGDGDTGDGDTGDGDTGDGDTGDGDTGDGDTGDGDTGDGDYPDCGVGGDASFSYSYIDFDPEQPDAEYHAVCMVASVTTDANQTTVLFDCPDDYHPGVVVTAQPMWIPNFEVGTPLDVHLEWLGKWSSGEWTYGTTWALASVEDTNIVAALVDVHRWYGEAPLGMHQVSELCEPQGWCDGPDGQLPESQNVGLEFAVDGETLTLFAGNSGQLGDYDILVDEANYSACDDQLDSAPGLYRVFVARH
jgi:hypothetical protein